MTADTPVGRWNVLSLFSGIGGLELGLERAGMTCVGQVEINEYCRRVLARHWPEVPRHDDVRTAPAWWRSQPRPAVDLVAGGFPCQGHSNAGRQLGTADPRWGWPWFRGVIDEVAPPFVLIENVPGLVRTGLLDVLGDLAGRGFDAWWGRVPAAAVGAPHLRWRLFVIAAHTERVALRQQPGWERGADGQDPAVTGFDGAQWALAHPTGSRGTNQPPSDPRPGLPQRTVPGTGRRAGRGDSPAGDRRSDRSAALVAAALADPDGRGRDTDFDRVRRGQPDVAGGGTPVADSVGAAGGFPRAAVPGTGSEAAGVAVEPRRRGSGVDLGTWPAEPGVGRVAHGVPDRLDRLRALGNAVVPAVGEYVGRLLIDGSR